MALPIIPKSECRVVNNISHGYGEVAYIELPDGTPGWVYPDQTITTDPDEALEMAKTLDVTIRELMSKEPSKPTLH